MFLPLFVAIFVNVLVLLSNVLIVIEMVLGNSKQLHKYKDDHGHVSL